MKKLLFSGWITSIFVTSLATIFIMRGCDKPIPAPVVTPPVAPIIVRKPDITFEQALGHLHHYDTDLPTLDWKTVELNKKTIKVEVDGKLYQREFKGQAEFPLLEAESQNWKFTFGLVAGIATTAGITYLVYKIIK